MNILPAKARAFWYIRPYIKVLLKPELNDKTRVLHNLRPRAKNGYFLFPARQQSAVYSIVNEHLRTTLGAKRGLFAKVSKLVAPDNQHHA